MELYSLNISIGVQKLSGCQRAQIWDELKPICNYTTTGSKKRMIKKNMQDSKCGKKDKSKPLCERNRWRNLCVPITSSSSGKGSKTKTASSAKLDLALARLFKTATSHGTKIIHLPETVSKKWKNGSISPAHRSEAIFLWIDVFFNEKIWSFQSHSPSSKCLLP